MRRGFRRFRLDPVQLLFHRRQGNRRKCLLFRLSALLFGSQSRRRRTVGLRGRQGGSVRGWQHGCRGNRGLGCPCLCGRHGVALLQPLGILLPPLIPLGVRLVRRAGVIARWRGGFVALVLTKVRCGRIHDGQGKLLRWKHAGRWHAKYRWN